MLLGMLGSAALADPEDTWNLVAGAQVLYDNNLFRTANNEDADRIMITTAGLRVNKAYSLQRFVVDASVSDQRYQDNKKLNHLAKNGYAAWQWSVTPSLHGALSTRYSEALNNFADYRGTQKNMRTNKTHRFDAEWETWGRFRLLGAIDRTEVENSQLINEEGDYEADSAEYGLKYQMPSGSNYAIVSRLTDGKYMKRRLNAVSQIDTGFKERNVELRTLVVASGKTRINAKVGRVERKHDNFASRDYDGTTGGFDLTWQPTGKLQFNLGWEKGFGSYQNFESSYYSKQAWKFSAIWQLRPKIALRGSYRDETLDYKGEILPIQPLREDRLKTASLSLEWSPLTSATFALSATQMERNSNRDILDFKSRMIGASVNLMF